MPEQEVTLPIIRVTLYTSGVGYFERGGEVDGDARLTLLFPTGQVNDVLKSLVLRDTGDGQIQPVTYAAQDPVSRALQAFSVNVGDTPDRATLLNRVRGTSLTVTMPEETLTGVILSVEVDTEVLAERGTADRYTLNLLADDGLVSVPLADVRRLRFNDAKLADELRQALAAVAQGRDANKRPLTMAFSGTGRREISVGYIAEAPAWHTTYRLVLGDRPLLQGWALVQNTGQDDWHEAHLSLVSGRPISFIQDLYTPLYVRRPTVKPRILASPTPQTYASDLNSALVIDGAPAERPVPPPMAAMPAPAGGVSSVRQRKAALPIDEVVGGSVASTGAQLGAALFAYHIDVPVSIPRGQSAMIPFTSSEVQAEPVSVYNAYVQRDHPLSGVRLRNTTGLHLMGGPLTVFQDGGYVGDALTDDTEPGQTRLLTYAVDLAVDAAHERDGQESRVTAGTISGGVLSIQNTLRHVSRYTFKNHSATPRTVIVERPYAGDEWHLREPAEPTERTAQVLRFDLAVPAGASAGLTVALERVTFEETALLDADPDLLFLSSHNDAVTQPVRDALADVVARRRALTDMEIKITDIDGQTERVAQEQARIRQNMQNLEYKSELYKRYVGELDSQENQLVGLRARREALRQERQAAQESLSQHLSTLDLS